MTYNEERELKKSQAAILDKIDGDVWDIKQKIRELEYEIASKQVERVKYLIANLPIEDVAVMLSPNKYYARELRRMRNW